MYIEDEDPETSCIKESRTRAFERRNKKKDSGKNRNKNRMGRRKFLQNQVTTRELEESIINSDSTEDTD
jgi:hypothetical protein